MATECLFCRIAAHNAGAHVLYEDDLIMAFLALSDQTWALVDHTETTFRLL